jgi:hypothetical protein
LYETPNVDIVLEPRNLWTKEWPTWHWVFLVGIGSRREVWGFVKTPWLQKGIFSEGDPT